MIKVELISLYYFNMGTEITEWPVAYKEIKKTMAQKLFIFHVLNKIY